MTSTDIRCNTREVDELVSFIHCSIEKGNSFQDIRKELTMLGKSETRILKAVHKFLSLNNEQRGPEIIAAAPRKTVSPAASEKRAPINETPIGKSSVHQWLVFDNETQSVQLETTQAPRRQPIAVKKSR